MIWESMLIYMDLHNLNPYEPLMEPLKEPLKDPLG